MKKYHPWADPNVAEPVIDNNCDILIVGTFPSTADAPFYHTRLDSSDTVRSLFMILDAAIGGVNCQPNEKGNFTKDHPYKWNNISNTSTPEKKIDFLLKNNIAYCDIIASIELSDKSWPSSDEELKKRSLEYINLSKLVKDYPNIKHIIVNGNSPTSTEGFIKKSIEFFKAKNEWSDDDVLRNRLCLPAVSPRNRCQGWSDTNLIEFYKKFLKENRSNMS